MEDVKEGGLVELFNARLERDGGPMAARALRRGDEVLSVNGAIGTCAGCRGSPRSISNK